MKFGYARVSRTDQNLELQTDALTKAGVDQIFSDKISGAAAERGGLSELLTIAREGDCVVVWKLDRLARSLKQLIELLTEFDRRKIQLIVLQENIDTTTPTGKLFFHIFGALAEFERNVIIERTRSGLDAAKACGRRCDRRPVLNAERQEAARKFFEAEQGFPVVARTLGVPNARFGDSPLAIT